MNNYKFHKKSLENFIYKSILKNIDDYYQIHTEHTTLYFTNKRTKRTYEIFYGVTENLQEDITLMWNFLRILKDK